MPPKKRKRIRPGTRVPYVEHAGIDLYKFTKYALRPDIEPGKAKRFRKLLGITINEWQYLHDQLIQRLPHAEATHVCLDDPDIVEFSVPILVDGLNGQQRVVETGWAIDARHEPWLTTLYATRRRAL